MKKTHYLFATGIILVLCAFTFSLSTNWKIGKNHSIEFAGTDAEGIFKTLTGTVVFDEAKLAESKFSFKVDVSSINTGNGMKNKHAVSDKWFDAKKYPTIQFTSSKITKTSKGYSVTGTMEIHGVKKVMTVPFTFTNSTIKANFSVNRMDFKVGTMEGMSKKVSNAIKLNVSIPVTK